MENLGKLIKDARLKLRMRQIDVAKHVGMERSSVSNWELGRSQPDLYTLRKLSQVLHLNLFSDNTENTPIQEATGRKIPLKLSDTPFIEVISSENACIFSDFTINIQVNGSDSHGNSVIFRVNAAFCIENDGK